MRIKIVNKPMHSIHEYSSKVSAGDGERMCQMVITKCKRAERIEVNELNESERGSVGFGHTGK